MTKTGLTSALVPAGLLTLLLIFPAAPAVATPPPEEAAPPPGLNWTATYLRESAMLFPLSSIVQTIDNDSAMVRMVRKAAPESAASQYAPVQRMRYLPDRTGLFVRSSLWIEERRLPDGTWQVKMVNLDGSTTTSIKYDGSKTATLSELTSLDTGQAPLLHEESEPGSQLPEDCLDLERFRPGRFSALVGNAGCPTTYVQEYRADDASTRTIVCDVGNRSLISEVTSYTTGALAWKAEGTALSTEGGDWPARIVETRLDVDGAQSRVTTYTIMKLATQTNVDAFAVKDSGALSR